MGLEFCSRGKTFLNQLSFLISCNDAVDPVATTTTTTTTIVYSMINNNTLKTACNSQLAPEYDGTIGECSVYQLKGNKLFSMMFRPDGLVIFRALDLKTTRASGQNNTLFTAWSTPQLMHVEPSTGSKFFAKISVSFAMPFKLQ